MRYKRQHIIIIAAAFAILFFGFRQFTKAIYADEINLTVYMKMYNNAGVRLFYSSKPNEYLLTQSDMQLLFASQYYKGFTFKIPDISFVRHLRLDLGDAANEAFIERVELSVKNVSRTERVGEWKGNEIAGIIGTYNDARLQAYNSAYVHIAAGKTDPYFLLNEVPFQTINRYYKEHSQANPAQWGATIILSLFFIAVIAYFVPRAHFPPFNVFVQRGGVLTAGAALIIFFIFLNNRFILIPDRQNMENRSQAPKPELTLQNFFSYPDQYSDYARDNFSFRNHLYYLHSLYMVKLFKETPMPEDALYGKEDWFFDNEQGGVNDYRRITHVSQEELARLTKTFYERKKWLDERGIKFYIIIPPNKHSVYPEYLPDGFFETTGIGENRLKVYKEHLAKYNGITMVDPTDALLAAKKKREVYYKTDTHWNLYGGFIAYQELMKEICKDFPQLKPAKEEDFNITTFYTTEGDLAKVVGLNELFKRQEISLTPKDTSVKLTMPTASEIVINYDSNKTVDGSTLKLVMMRDSYSNYLIPYLNLHFQKARYLWTYDFPDKIIEAEKPDVVIFESLQRFMFSAFAIPNPESLDTSKAKTQVPTKYKDPEF